MDEDESAFVNDDECLLKDLDEESITLLKLAQVHVTGKKLFASDSEVKKRSKEKNITFYQARKELINESKSEREQLLNEAQRLLRPTLSKETKKKLGIKEAGRPKGSKNKTSKTSKTEFYKELTKLAKSKYELGEEMSQKEACEAMGYSGERQLRRLLGEWGEERKWRDLISDLLIE